MLGIQAFQEPLALLEDAGRPVAAQLFLKDVESASAPAQSLYLYQSGRDPANDQMRVGRILALATIREACHRGVDSIDYLRGDEIYKARMGAQPAECWRVRAIAPTTTGRLRYGVWCLGQSLKDRHRPVLPYPLLRPAAGFHG